MTCDVWVSGAQIATAIGVIFTGISSIYNRYEIRKATQKVEAVNKAVVEVKTEVLKNGRTI
jgi:hypothetical protein